MNTQETKYGNIIKGLEYYNPDPRFNSVKSRRIDKYTSKQNSVPTEESIMCLNHKDLSDQFIQGENGEYNPVCYGCWAGVGHTLDYHNSHKGKTL